MTPETYKLEICGLTRELPVIRVSRDLAIASFVMLGDTELIESCAEGIAGHPDFRSAKPDILVCPEAKAIPLTHALARILGMNYIVVRKSAKAYMENPLSVSANSITTEGEQSLVLDGRDTDILSGRNVAIIDDVVSTGGSLKALEMLLAKTGCSISCRAAVLLEDAGHSGEGLVYLGKLPIFPQ